MNMAKRSCIGLLVFCMAVAANANGAFPQFALPVNQNEVHFVEDMSRIPVDVDSSNEFMRRLEPVVEKGRLAQSDLRGLVVCMFFMCAQAKCYCDFAEKEMGIDGLAVSWPEIKTGNNDLDVYIASLEGRLQKNQIVDYDEITNRLAIRSFCKKYNTKEGTQLFMAKKLEAIVKESQQEETERPDTMVEIQLDVSKYGDFPKLSWWAKVWYGSRKKYFVETVPATNEKVKSYLEKRRNVPADLNEVLVNENGPYRKAYIDLARITRLVKKCKERGWPGLDITDYDKKGLDVSVEKAENAARNMLKYMERAYVDYPLLFELTEATSICLYLHYIDENAQKRIFPKVNILGYTEHTDPIRKEFLDNAEDLGYICSRLLTHSSLNTANYCADVYNGAFPWVYATNRNDFARGGSEDAEIVFRNKYNPLVKDDEKAKVANGKIETSQRDLRRKMRKIVDSLKSDKELQQVLAAGWRHDEETFENWLERAQRIIPDEILYPLWCDETAQMLAQDSITRKVEKWYDEWTGGQVQQIKKKVDAIRCSLEKKADAKARQSGWSLMKLRLGFGQSELVKGLKSFESCIARVDGIESMRSNFVYEMRDSRKVSASLGEKLRDVEAKIDAWIEKLSSRVDDIDDLQNYMEKNIIPLWNECQKARRKIVW